MSGTVQPAQTATQLVSSGAAGIFPIGFGYYPVEGSRVVTPEYNWLNTTGIPAYAEDLSQLVARGVETSIQGVVIDNATNANPVTITIGGSGQVLTVPAYSQGVFPIFFTGTPSYQVTSPLSNNSLTVTPSGYTPVTRCYWLNVPPQAAGVWPCSIAPQWNILNLSGNNTPRVGPGRLMAVIVTTAISVGALNFYDGGATVANLLFSIPVGAAAGTIYQLNIPFFTSLFVDFAINGAVGVVNVFIS